MGVVEVVGGVEEGAGESRENQISYLHVSLAQLGSLLVSFCASPSFSLIASFLAQPRSVRTDGAMEASIDQKS